jgi:hypothetical protein
MRCFGLGIANKLTVAAATRHPPRKQQNTNLGIEMAAYYTFEDLSGTSTPVTGDNPYQDLIAACHDDPVLNFTHKQHCIPLS